VRWITRSHVRGDSHELALDRIAQTLAAIERNIMARLQILEFPDPRLRTRAKPVEVFDKALSQLVADMFETMYAAPGVGLAATQVDVHKRLIVMDVSEGKDHPQVFINPEILAREGVGVTEEGCLSVPGIFDEVKRAAVVRARAQDPTGKVFEVDLDGLAAVCLQHEMDHLEGKLFVDYLSDIKRERIRKKLEKDRKERASRAREPAGARAY
jgi:peptide deformylase